MRDTKSILIVDDHQMFLDGVKSLLDGQDRYTISAEANDGKTALKLMDENPFDILITDLSMPEMSGTELVQAVKKSYPEMKVLVLSMHNNRETVGEILMAEAEGYILKNTGKKELLEALDRISDDGTFYSNDVMSIMFERMQKERKIESATKSLTEREIEILELIAQELSSEEIADKLFISRRTVDTHRKNIFQKTECKTLVGLIKYAIRNEIAKLD